MYLLIVSGLASPIEQTKYPSDQKVCSLKKCLDKNTGKYFHNDMVLSCFNLRTIELQARNINISK